MTTLNFGHRNAIHGTLRELALHTEDFIALFAAPRDSSRILGVVGLPNQQERDRVLRELNSLREAILTMSRSLEIELEPVNAMHKLHNVSAYMIAAIQNVTPERLQGYGSVSTEDAVIIRRQIHNILSALQAF